MGNCLLGKRAAKVMRVDGRTIQFKTPVNAGEVIKQYSGHILLDSESVKNLGIRAKPLEPKQELKPERLYFLVEPPPNTAAQEVFPRRGRSSGIQMSAKDRLESLMLARTRSASHILSAKSSPAAVMQSEDGGVRVKLRMHKAELEKLVMQSDHDRGEAVEKIMRLCMENNLHAAANKPGTTRNPDPTPGIMKNGLKSSKALKKFITR
ncbi:unnamed protein product [Cuscuta europaea]|uniref:Uncharacterized protein n=1 Tax=Cuscuta europaea TaxID=41803 RepID=A0A9P1EMI8_CUSEU|nr:unnamed protein product [Cuscuta europaea]